MTGWITQVTRGRACGFIRSADGQDVFFHASALEGISLDQLRDRLAVRFTLVRDDVSGPRAEGVRVDRRESAAAKPRVRRTRPVLGR
jgi:cold shock CspA family protein